MNIETQSAEDLSVASDTAAEMSLDSLFPSSLTKLNGVLADAGSSDYYKGAYQGLTAADLTSLSQLESLPILRKSDFIELQKNNMPFGGLMAKSSRPDYLFVSPGPIHEPGFLDPDFWGMQAVLKAVDLTADDVVHNTFSYHLTPGAWIFDSGSRAIGCSTIPAGNAPMEQQLHAIEQYAASCYVGTPDFLKKIIEAYAAAGMGKFPITKAVVGGGPFTPGLREFFAQANIKVAQCYATAELGCIAYEDPGDTTMKVCDNIIVEIVNPDTGQAMPYGATGEVVVTTLRKDYPLIRFGTGDLSAFVTDGSGGTSIKGWLGRSDQAVKVRGMFVRPEQLESIRASVDGLEKLRLVIDRENEQDTAVLFCSLNAEPTDAKAQEISTALRQTCHLNIKVSLVDESTMTDDGKLIVDMR